MPCPHRKHTEIVSKAQRGLMGAELARRRTGKRRRMAGITTKELESHLRESKGKKLVARKRTYKRGSGVLMGDETLRKVGAL